MLDANANFTTNAITRRGIADDLNCQLGREEFTSTDDRLTNEFCARYAAALGEINCADLSEDDRSEKVAEMDRRYLSEFGLESSDD